MATQSTSTLPASRPWWREKFILALATVVVLISCLILFQDRLFPGTKVTASDKSALPAGAGGGFCDVPVPVKSTDYNPSTRKSP